MHVKRIPVPVIVVLVLLSCLCVLVFVACAYELLHLCIVVKVLSDAMQSPIKARTLCLLFQLTLYVPRVARAQHYVKLDLVSTLVDISLLETRC